MKEGESDGGLEKFARINKKGKNGRKLEKSPWLIAGKLRCLLPTGDRKM